MNVDCIITLSHTCSSLKELIENYCSLSLDQKDMEKTGKWKISGRKLIKLSLSVNRRVEQIRNDTEICKMFNILENLDLSEVIEFTISIHGYNCINAKIKEHFFAFSASRSQNCLPKSRQKYIEKSMYFCRFFW